MRGFVGELGVLGGRTNTGVRKCERTSSERTKLGDILLALLLLLQLDGGVDDRLHGATGHP